MFNDLFVMQIPILEKILRTVLVYVVIIVLFRLTGKRGLAGLNTAVNRLIAVSPVAARVFEGTATTVITDGQIDRRAVRRLGLRRTELEHAVRIQNGDTTDDVNLGLLEPTGQLVLTLAHDAQPASRGDLALLLARLDHIDQQLTIARRHDQG